MKKFILLLIAFCFVSCASVKESKSTSVTNTKEKQVTNNDSIYFALISKRIDDLISIPVVKEDTGDSIFDKAVNDAVDKILSRLNVQKSSGDNNYKLYFDKLSREIRFNTQVGETKSENTNVKKDTTVEKSFEQQTDEYIYKKIRVIPWYIWVILAIILIPMAIGWFNNIKALFVPKIT